MARARSSASPDRGRGAAHAIPSGYPIRRGPVKAPSVLVLDCEAAFGGSRTESGVVALVLVRVRGRELEQRAVERVALAEVGRERDAVAGARVCAGEQEAADISVDLEAAWVDRVEVDRALPVPELAEVEVTRRPVERLLCVRPAEEDV